MGEIIFDIIMLVTAGVMAISALQLNVSAGDLSAKFWPFSILAALLILLAIKLFTLVKHLKPEEKTIDFSILKQKNVQYLLMAFALLFSYAFALPYLGYIISSFLFCIIMEWILGLRSVGKSLLFAAIITMVLFAIFAWGLGVHPPRGIGVFEDFSKWAEYLIG